MQIIEIEEWIQACCSEANLRVWGDHSIHNYTVNVGPKCPNWTYPMDGFWWFSSMTDFNEQNGMVSDFVRGLAFPFVSEHEDPLAVRRTLLENPGHATNIVPYQ